MHKSTLVLLAAMTIPVGSALATPGIGISSQAFRNSISANVYASQWGPSPLFSLLLMTSNDDWGYDLIHNIITLAPADPMGTPTQSGWHDHPVPLGLVQIVQGALWVQEKPNVGCLTYYPTGSVLTETQGNIHNVFNFDKQVPTVLSVTWFIERSVLSARRDQPDQVTGDPNVAGPPPALCPDSPVPPSRNKPQR
jgi:hypothetical protein